MGYHHLNTAAVPDAAPEPVGPAILVASAAQGGRRLQDWVRREFPACRVYFAEGRTEARAIAVAVEPAVALVDLDARALGGIETLWMLRTVVPEASPIALSAYHSGAMHDFAIGAGAVACMSPQAAPEGLRALIAGLLAAAVAREAPK
jgi:DNA-binding NarL/FixJ family response regulator